MTTLCYTTSFSFVSNMIQGKDEEEIEQCLVTRQWMITHAHTHTHTHTHDYRF